MEEVKLNVGNKKRNELHEGIKLIRIKTNILKKGN